MQGREKIATRGQVELRKGGTCVDFRCKVIQDFLDRVPRNEDSIAVDTFVDKILLASVRVWKEDTARVINDSAVDLFRDGVVESAISRFHMKDRDSLSGRDDRR